MSEVKVYIKVECSKELPKKEGKFITNLGQAIFSDNEYRGKYWTGIEILISNPDWWLKEINLSELMSKVYDQAIEDFNTAEGHDGLALAKHTTINSLIKE